MGTSTSARVLIAPAVNRAMRQNHPAIRFIGYSTGNLCGFLSSVSANSFRLDGHPSERAEFAEPRWLLRRFTHDNAVWWEGPAPRT